MQVVPWQGFLVHRVLDVEIHAVALGAENDVLACQVDGVHVVVPVHDVNRWAVHARRHAAPADAQVGAARLAAGKLALGPRTLLLLAVAVHLKKCADVLFVQLLHIALSMQQAVGDDKVLRARLASIGIRAVLMHSEQRHVALVL